MTMIEEKNDYFILPVKYAVSQKNTTIYFKWVLSLKVYRDGACLWCASKIEYEFHGDPSSHLLWELTHSFIFFFFRLPGNPGLLTSTYNHGKRQNTSNCYFVHYPPSALFSCRPDNSSNDGRGKERNILCVNTHAVWRIQWGLIITELKISTNHLQPQMNSIHELRMGNIELC